MPSKALLAAAGSLRKLKDEHHMKALGIQVRALLCWVTVIRLLFAAANATHSAGVFHTASRGLLVRPGAYLAPLKLLLPSCSCPPSLTMFLFTAG